MRRESYKRDGVKRHRIEFRQTIHGMPLDQTGKIVVSDDGYVLSISVMAVDDTWLDSDSAALITEEEALQVVINDLKKYGLSEIEQSPSTYFVGYVVSSHRKLSPVLIAGFSARSQGRGTVGYTARVNLNNGEVNSWPSEDEFLDHIHRPNSPVTNTTSQGPDTVFFPSIAERVLDRRDSLAFYSNVRVYAQDRRPEDRN